MIYFYVANMAASDGLMVSLSGPSGPIEVDIKQRERIGTLANRLVCVCLAETARDLSCVTSPYRFTHTHEDVSIRQSGQTHASVL